MRLRRAPEARRGSPTRSCAGSEDFAEIKGDGTIDQKITEFALDALNVDRKGLDEMDNRILTALIDKFNGGPVGASTIATAIGENPGTLEEVYEPYLIKKGCWCGRRVGVKPPLRPMRTWAARRKGNRAPCLAADHGQTRTHSTGPQAGVGSRGQGLGI
jgi:hypothetical protein